MKRAEISFHDILLANLGIDKTTDDRQKECCDGILPHFSTLLFWVLGVVDSIICNEPGERAKELLKVNSE